MIGIEKFFKSGYVIERKTETKKTGGAVIQAWVTHLTVDGCLRQLTAEERIAAGQKTGFSTHRLYTHVADITLADRLNVSGTIYEIKGPPNNPMGMDRFLQIDLELML